MKQYESFDDIEKDLKRLSLERNIALEEMKLLKSEFKDDLKPINWVSSIFSILGKYGLYAVVKRIFR